MADDFDDTAEKEIRNTLLHKAQQLKVRRQQRWSADFIGGVWRRLAGYAFSGRFFLAFEPAVFRLCLGIDKCLLLAENRR